MSSPLAILRVMRVNSHYLLVYDFATGKMSIGAEELGRLIGKTNGDIRTMFRMAGMELE